MLIIILAWLCNNANWCEYKILRREKRYIDTERWGYPSAVVRRERGGRHTICARVRRSGGRRREVSWCQPRTAPRADRDGATAAPSLRCAFSSASHPCINRNMITLSTIMFWLSVHIHSRKPIPRHNNIIRLSTTSRTRSPSLQTDTVYQHARYWADDTWKIDAIPSRNRQPLAADRWWTANQRPAFNRTCNPSGAVFCERLKIDSESVVGRVHAVIDRTHRALVRSRHADQLSRRLLNRHWITGTGNTGCWFR